METVKKVLKKIWCVGVSVKKKNKKGKYVYNISHVMHTQKGWGHIVWDICPLRFCVHPTCITRSKIGLPSASCIWPIMKNYGLHKMLL